MNSVVSRLDFEEAIRSHAGRLRAAAFQILRDRSEAEDAVQDGLLSAYQALPRFRGAALLSTWLHRIVVNAALMRLRARRRRPERTLPEGDLAASQLTLASASSVPTPEDRCASREVVERVADSITCLSPGQRRVLELGVFEGLAHGEIADRTGETRGAVKVRLHRARRSLRRDVGLPRRVTTRSDRQAKPAPESRIGTP